MHRSRSAIGGVVVIALLLSARPRLVTSGPADASPRAVSAPTATLRSASGTTIEYRTNNDRTVDGLPSRTVAVPHLVLLRSSSLTDPDERTIIVEVASIQAPPGGVTVTLTVSTAHVDPDAAPILAAPIPVWREARYVASTGGSPQAASTVVFTRTFSETVSVDGKEVPTPTDYFRYSISIDGPETDGTGSLLELGGEFAFLMENQVVAPLPDVLEESEGAAPDELVVCYCDMSPFRWRTSDGSDRLPRGDVSGFVENRLVPAMVEAFCVQSDDWGFQWHDAWTSYRPEAGPGQLSVALTDDQTWFHGWAPVTGQAGISINVSREDNDHYDSLTDAILSTFHHELFHNLQRSICQDTGGDGRVDGQDGAWHWFSEGTAVLASSVGQPAVQFTQTSGVRYHMLSSNRFFLLNLKDRQVMPASEAVVYWRFLYEQCGGMTEGAEDTGAGMRVIREALAALYSRDIVDIGSATGVPESVPQVMDQALANVSSCPFETYEDSLNHFARAVYALRLETGRCTAPGTPEGCGFYDPEELYTIAQPQTILYRGSERRHSAVIYSSSGMDFLDVMLHPATDGQPLVLELEGAPGGSAEFSVQVWRLVDVELGGKPRPIPEQAAGPEVVGTAGPGGRITYTIPAIDVTAYNRLGILITRVDVNERSDPLGTYTIRLHP